MQTEPRIITAAEMDHHKARGLRLRDRAIDDAFAALARWTRTALRRLAHPALWFRLPRVHS